MSRARTTYLLVLGVAVAAGCSPGGPNENGDSNVVADAGVVFRTCTAELPPLRPTVEACWRDREVHLGGNQDGAFVLNRVPQSCSSTGTAVRFGDPDLKAVPSSVCADGTAAIVTRVEIVDYVDDVRVAFEGSKRGVATFAVRCLRSQFVPPQTVQWGDRSVLIERGCSTACADSTAIHIFGGATETVICTSTIAQAHPGIMFVELVAARSTPPSLVLAEYASLTARPTLGYYSVDLATDPPAVTRRATIDESAGQLRLVPDEDEYVAVRTSTNTLVHGRLSGDRFTATPLAGFMPFAGELDEVRRLSADTIALRMRLSMAASERTGVSRAWIVADNALSIRGFIEASDEIEFPILQGDQPGVVRRRADCPAAGQSCVSIEPLPLRAISQLSGE